MKSVPVRDIWEFPLYSPTRMIIKSQWINVYPLLYADGSGAYGVCWGDDLLIFDEFEELLNTMEKIID